MKKGEILLKRLKAEITSELDHISTLMNEYRDFLEKYSSHMDVYLLRIKASFMADFYMGVEKIFRLIAEEINGGTPQGELWHKKILHNMTLEIKDVRPAIISKELYLDLIKFLGFRHVVRQAYGFQLDEDKLLELEKAFEPTWMKFNEEIQKFCNFLVKEKP